MGKWKKEERRERGGPTRPSSRWLYTTNTSETSTVWRCCWYCHTTDFQPCNTLYFFGKDTVAVGSHFSSTFIIDCATDGTFTRISATTVS